MDFIEDHWEYIKECAECRALEIAKLMCNYSDIDDYKQDIYLWIVKRAQFYDPSRSKPNTFIAMTTMTAKKRIIRKLLRKKNTMIKNAKNI